MANTIPPGEINIDGSAGAGGSINLSNLLPQVLEKFVAVLEGAAIIAAGFLLMVYIRKKIQKIEIAHEQQRTVLNLLEKITSGFLIVISVTIALKVIGIDMTLLVSVLILGLSYGLQDIIKNYVAGILILFKAPFKIGEIVKIRTYTGRVVKMDFQATIIETFDHRTVTIYNSDVMTQSIINFSNHTVRRLKIDVMLGYGSDIQSALTIFDKLLKNNTAVLKNPVHSIVFNKFSDSGAIFTLKFWVQLPCNILQIRSGIATQISEAFDEAKIFMPYTKDVQTESDYTLVDARKERIKNFYAQPAFAEAGVAAGIPAAAETGAGIPLTPGQTAPEVVDAEEPEPDEEY